MKKRLRDLLARAIEKTARGGELDETDLPFLLLEPPKQKEFGDVASNVALVWAKALRKPPRALAEAILKNIEDPEGILAKAEIAGPGFLNFTFSPDFCTRELRRMAGGGDEVANLGHGAKVQVEFASANPTGPLHVGHGRVAVIGDVLARLLQAVGYEVDREYYVNDTGRQMEMLGLSVYLRYREIYGHEAVFPPDAYPGEYLKDVALEARSRWGDRFLSEEPSRAVEILSRFGGEAMLRNIREDLKEFGITFNSFASERELRERGEVAQTVDFLCDRGLIYEEEGAKWFRATAYGDDKDRTVIKSDGDLTYFASDAAYHRNKLERGYQKLVNVWGADHHGYVQRVKAALSALGYDPELLQVVLVQMVKLTRGGEPVRMGKRLGEFVSLREVLEEVGRDAARFFFLMRKADTQLEFDLELAKRESSENPVFYVQYAHARIASIFEQAGRAGINASEGAVGKAPVERLELAEELDLIKKTLQFNEVIEESARELEPHRVVFYLLDLAGEFHRYYNHHRVISDDSGLTQARLLLVLVVQRVLRKGLELLGVQAPLKMASRSVEGNRDAGPRVSESGERSDG